MHPVPKTLRRELTLQLSILRTRHPQPMKPARPWPGPPCKGRPAALGASPCPQRAALRERGEGAKGDSATVFKVKRFFMQRPPVDNVAPTQCSI